MVFCFEESFDVNSEKSYFRSLPAKRAATGALGNKFFTEASNEEMHIGGNITK